MELLETLNRTLKLAMDEGKVGSYEEAKTLFGTFKLRISVQQGFAAVPAKQAAVLTLLNAAPKTFLGGVELDGALNERCTMAWFAGMTLSEVAQQFGVTTTAGATDASIPTVFIDGDTQSAGDFSLGVSLAADGFVLSPEQCAACSTGAPVEVGVAAAGAALNEVFQHAYRQAPLAGQREIQWKLPAAGHGHAARGIWVVGLGHLGQAFLWTAALAGGAHLAHAIRLTDYDHVSWSSLSTCLLINAQDVGRKKVDVVAERLEALGVSVQRDYDRLNLDDKVVRSDHELVVIAVDNVALRRSLDHLKAERVLEAGIGDGVNAFTRIQLHAFPGPRKSRDIWFGDDARATRPIDISQPAYQLLLKESGDECGTTMVAGRSVATPFVGAFAGAVLSRLTACPSASDSEHAWSFDVSSL